MKNNKTKKNMEKHYSSVYKKWFKGFTLQEGMSIKTFKRDLPKSHTMLYRKRGAFIALTVCHSKESEDCLVG